jgi:hypothetical protein
MGRRISDPMSTSPSQRVIEAAILECIRRGFVEVIQSDDGVLRYRITDLGVKYFESVIAGEKEE